MPGRPREAEEWSAPRNCRPIPFERQWRRWLGGFLAIAAVVFPRCGQNETRANADPPPIEIRATVRPAQAMTLTAQVDGIIETIFVRQGERIEADGQVVQISNPAIERDAAVSRSQLDWIEARLRRGGRPAPVAPARPRDNLEITQKILELRKERFDKMKALRNSNDVTARELEQAEIEYLVALRDWNHERSILGGAAPAPADDTELLRIEQEKAAAEQRFAAARRDLLRVTSPIAGTVTRLHVGPEQAVFPRDPIADVADVSNVQVRGDIAPELLRYVRPGMRVDVRILSVPVRTFADEIDSVLAQGGGVDSRSAAVIVVLPNPDGSLQPNTEALITLRSIR